MVQILPVIWSFSATQEQALSFLASIIPKYFALKMLYDTMTRGEKRYAPEKTNGE